MKARPMRPPAYAIKGSVGETPVAGMDAYWFEAVHNNIRNPVGDLWREEGGRK